MVSNFFPVGSGTRAAGQHALLKRVLFFAAALLFLWLALQLKPAAPPVSESSQVFSDEAGSVAAHQAPTEAPTRYGAWLAGAVLIGLLGFAFHRLRRTAGEATAPLPIELLAQQALGPGQSLHLVRCGDKRLLLGVTAHQITLIDRLPPEQEAAPVSAPVSPAPAEFSTFLYRALRPSPHGH